MGKEMNILALDPATNMGWATRNAFGVWSFTVKMDESAGMRLLRLRAKLKEVFDIEKIELVVFERPGGQHARAVMVQSQLQGIIMAECEERKIPYRAYSSQEIKKFATGKGNVGKPEMIKAAKFRLGYTGGDDNEADALWLYELAKTDLGLGGERIRMSLESYVKLTKK